MTDYAKLYDGISRAAWGYFFICFNLNINTVSLLPSFLGYMLFLSAIGKLKDEERELSLLRTLGIILTAWHAGQWLLSWFGLRFDGVWQFADILVSLVNLYFHFQLLTNLASIASRHQQGECCQDQKLLRCRTVQTVMLTAITLVTQFSPLLSELWAYIPAVMAVIYVVAEICIMKALFDLRKHLPAGTV